MYTVIVTLDVREDRIEEFLAGIHTNALASLNDEPGCVRFDVHRSIDPSNRFFLHEIYRDRAAFEVDHKAAPHYQVWQGVAERCVVPGSQHNAYAVPAFPDDIPGASCAMSEPPPFPYHVVDVDGAAVRVTDLGPAHRLRTLPYSIRVLLECAIRRGGHDHPDVARLHNWQETSAAGESIDLYATRVFLHDTNGVPTIVDLASMRAAAAEIGGDPMTVNPQIPAELVIDHSVIVDVFGTPDAAERNVAIEYERNAERDPVPTVGGADLRRVRRRPSRHGHHAPGQHRIPCPGDRVVGRPRLPRRVSGHGLSHDDGRRARRRRWQSGYPGRSGAARRAVLDDGAEGDRVYLSGHPSPRATATDLVLTITEMLRTYGVVGAFVEFTGPGLAVMPVADRATIANMCPEFGATLAYFPIDAATIDFLRFTGRPVDRIALVEAYAREQSLWHDPDEPIVYDDVIRIDLDSSWPSLAGPQRPQDRVDLDGAGASFRRARLGITVRAPTTNPPMWSWQA